MTLKLARLKAYLLIIVPLLLLSVVLLYYSISLPKITSTLRHSLLLEPYNSKNKTKSTWTEAIISSSPSSQRRAKAVIVVLAQNQDYDELHETLAKFELTFNRRFNYPYVFLNDEPFDDNFKAALTNLLLWQYGANVTNKAHRNVSFGLIPKEHWSFPEWINVTKAEQCRQEMMEHNVMFADRPSYFHMCRYFSGFLHRHPLLADFDYYWRIEPRAEFSCILDYDPFVFMMDRGIEYGYTLMMPENMNTLPTLWNTTKQFLKDVFPTLNISITRSPLLRFLLEMEDGADNITISKAKNDSIVGNLLLESVEGLTWDKNGCHFWSNFEIASFKFFRSDFYQSYFDYLDRACGFFYERWGDAPVHSLAIGMFLDSSQIHHFDDMGYQHDWESWCPIGKEFASKCFCDPESDDNMANGGNSNDVCLQQFMQQINHNLG